MKVYLDSIGCRLNQAEIEKFASQFHARGHEIVASPAEADLAVINTCSVTSEAASDSRQKIRQTGRAGCGRIVPVGCLSTLEGEALRSLEGVEQVVTNPDKDLLVNRILGVNLPANLFNKRKPVQGSRKRIRAFIKAQDGCDQHCTYCVTRIARGKSRSVPITEVVADIRAAENSGAKEAVISGVQLGSWGRDLSPSSDIAWLVRSVLTETTIPRLRLSSIEPWDLPDDFFSLWEDKRLCAQLHLPLQSGSPATLKRMGRINSPDSYREIVGKIREAVPKIAITTDIIVGFPGESDIEFRESFEFTESMGFAGGHVFHYSPREGTPAAMLPGNVDFRVKKDRSLQMRTCLADSGSKYRQNFLGEYMDVLWETANQVGDDLWQLSGLTGNYLRVKALDIAPRINQISQVQLERLESGYIAGRIVNPAGL